MKLLTKVDLDSTLGKESFWLPIRLVGDATYVSGVEAFDEIIDQKKSTLDLPQLVNLMVRPNGLEIQMMKGFKHYSVAIVKEEIQEISLEDKEQIFEQQEKSVIGRAIAGGLLAGPVGAIVGGMSGIGAKEVKAKMPDLLLSIQIKSQEAPIILACKYKNREKVDSFLKKNFTEVYTVASLKLQSVSEQTPPGV